MAIRISRGAELPLFLLCSVLIPVTALKALPIEHAIQDDAIARNGTEITRTFDLHEGLNIIGFPLITNQTIPTLFAPLIEQGVITRIADDRGRFYLPGQGYNNLPVHNPACAYWIQVTQDCRLTLRGRPVPPNYAIRLRSGSNGLIYTGQEPFRFRRGDLDWLPDEVIMVRDSRGSMCIPHSGFNGIGTVIPGEVLYFSVERNCFLIWPER